MKLTIRGGVYYVDFRTPSGSRLRPTTGIRVAHKDSSPEDRARAEAEAYRIAGEIVKQHMSPTPVSPERSLKPLLGTLMGQRYEQHWKHLAYGVPLKYTINKLVRELGHLPVDQLTAALIRSKYEDMRKAGTAVSTLNRYTNVIKSTLKIAIQDGVITKMPEFPKFSEKNLVRERYMLDHEEVRILGYMARMEQDDTVERRWQWEYLRNLIVFLTDTGFRFSEAFKFTLVDGHADLAHGCTKNTIGRRVPLTSRALAAAQYLLGASHHADLHAQQKQRVKAAWDWCNHRFEQCLRAVAINHKTTPRGARLTIHCLRHTCASRLLARGINLAVVSKWLGHSSIQITMRYIKLEKGAFSDAMAVLEANPNGGRNVDPESGREAEARAVGEVRDQRQPQRSGDHQPRRLRADH